MRTLASKHKSRDLSRHSWKGVPTKPTMPPNAPSDVALRRRGVGDKPQYTREEVYQHRKPGDVWVILHGEVYNVTSWLPRHPGGSKVLGHYGGQDASVSEALILFP